ncbi:hatching enzyme 1.2-like [Oncorhynchus tshawytscha]|uniref:hatching enzyme 1.2-like n=1 Tax=Oncorhynchus tshawytscha TaxID=74940 RepID=UPI001C3D4D35|nr:hatching enzyme 1.2-like [Oncorhynchus tshawytscha]
MSTPLPRVVLRSWKKRRRVKSESSQEAAVYKADASSTRHFLIPMMDLTVSSLLSMVVYTCCTWAIPAQSTSVSSKRFPKSYSDDHIIRSEMTAMDQIIEANEFQAAQVPDGTSFRDGDIAVTTGRRSKVCFARSCLWSKSVDGHVYIAYRLSLDYSDLDQRIIKSGMENMERGTCVRFVPWTHQRDYLDIQPKSGCWSFLGMTEGPQPISLQSPGCMWSGIVSHELMHALGFVHEQSRSDRDRHVSIIWENIRKGQKHNFKKYQTNNLNTVYDYGSIMHYGRYAFSEDGSPTIIPKPDPNTPIGQRDGPSVLDIQKINLLYECGGLV